MQQVEFFFAYDLYYILDWSVNLVMKQKKIPMRKCIGCQESKAKRELCRIVKDKDNSISFDSTGKKNGRGAYICPRIECIEAVRKGHRLEKEFEMHIGIEVYDELLEEIKKYIEKLGGGAIGK